jgi:hypothetical protein
MKTTPFVTSSAPWVEVMLSGNLPGFELILFAVTDVKGLRNVDSFCTYESESVYGCERDYTSI